MDIRNIFEQTFLWSAHFLMARVWKKLPLAGSVNRKHYLCKKEQNHKGSVLKAAVDRIEPVRVSLPTGF